MDTINATNYDGSLSLTCYLEGCGGWIKAVDQNGKEYLYDSQLQETEDSFCQFYVADDGTCVTVDGRGDAELWDSLEDAKEEA